MMAVTRIWKIGKRLDHVIDYTTNIEKTLNTEYGKEAYYELHNVIEYALKITGSLTKNIIAGHYAMSKDHKKTKGKTSLDKMLKSGKEIKVFTIKKEDLKLFQQEAKRYGVLYTALIDKKNKNFDGMVDIMTRAEDG